VKKKKTRKKKKKRRRRRRRRGDDNEYGEGYFSVVTKGVWSYVCLASAV
jgi:hypothetical protein